MHRWSFAAAVMTLTVAFPTLSAQAGEWFTTHTGYHADCYATCAVPTDCCPPAWHAPAAPLCHDGCADTYWMPKKECGLKRVGKRLWELEKRKNQCLLDTFCGRKHRREDCMDCVPNYYYYSQSMQAGGHHWR